MATLVGSPPNGIFARFVADRYHTEVSFLDWMQVALPVTLLLLPATFLLLNVLFPVKMDGIPGGREWIRNELRKLGPMSRGEKSSLPSLQEPHCYGSLDHFCAAWKLAVQHRSNP